MSTFSAPASATSGLQGYSLEGAEKPKRTLYIKRRVRNGADLVKWAKDAGFPTTLEADDLHVTIAYSKTAVDWDRIPRTDLPLLRIVGGDRKLKRLGKDGEAAVIGIESDDLTRRWGEIHAAGAVWSWPTYQPHITLSYAANEVSLDDIVPTGEVIELGPEEWAEVKPNWMASVVEKRAPMRAAGIALITHEGKMLYIKRSGAKGGDHADEWCIPGGGVEVGETPLQGAIREAFEEVGYKVDPTEEPIMVCEIATADVVFTTFFLRDVKEFKPELNHEHTGYRWAFIESPPRPLHSGLRAALPLIMSQAVELTTKSNPAVMTKSGAGEEPMDNLSIFVPVFKVDAKKRIVYGTAVVEEVDRSGEIFDYASSKPEFEKWSAGFEKATDGKSKGNVRAMHGKVAAGKLQDIGFDDKRKAIDVAAKIVDADEWKKVEEGVYTGFSIGGAYLKRWQDGDHKRYTARPAEISLVDLPCGPSATFSMIKADGSEELRKFAAPAATEPVVKTITNDDVAARAEELAKASGKHFIAHIEEARKQLETELAAEVAKAAQDSAAAETSAMAAEAASAAATTAAEAVTTDPVAKSNDGEAAPAAEAGTAEAEPVGDVTKTTPSDIAQVWVSDRLPGQHFAKKGELEKALIDLDAKEAVSKAAAPVLDAIKAAVGETAASAAESAAKVEDGAIATKEALSEAIKAFDFGKGGNAPRRALVKAARTLGALDLLPEGLVFVVKDAAEAAELAKGANLYTVASLSRMLACVEEMEETAEMGYGTPLPKELTDRFGTALVALGDIVADILDAVLKDIKAEEAEEAAKFAGHLVDLVKVGARNSRADKSTIKKAHDALVALDKDVCGGGMSKAAGEITVDLNVEGAEAIAKAVADAAAKAEAASAENALLKAEKAANAVVMQDIAAGIAKMADAMEVLKADNTSLKAQVEEVKKNSSSIEEVQKHVLAIRAMPVPAPHAGSYRIAEKVTTPDHSAISDEDLRRAAASAQAARMNGPHA